MKLFFTADELHDYGCVSLLGILAIILMLILSIRGVI